MNPKRTLAPAVAVTAAVLAATGLAALPAVGATKSVKLVDNKFRPSKITVKRGTTVKFTWAGKNPHNVTAFSGPVRFHSSTKTTGTYRKRLAKKGTYQITCTVHSGMTLTIKVR